MTLFFKRVFSFSLIFDILYTWACHGFDEVREDIAFGKSDDFIINNPLTGKTNNQGAFAPSFA